MARFRFNYYETVKYLVEFEAGTLEEAKEELWKVIHPQDLDGVEINELKSEMDIDYDLVEEV
jgi:hypothetical protein